MQLLLMGFLIGTIVSAPIGPIGTATLVETVAGNYRMAVASTAGCVSAELVLLSIAVFCVVHLDAVLGQVPRVVSLLVGLALVMMGLYYLLARRDVRLPPLTSFFIAFQITLLSPNNIAALVALIVAMGVAPYLDNLTSDVLFMLGELIGVIFCWALLIGLGWRLRQSEVAKKAVPLLRKGVAAVMIGAGLAIITQQMRAV